MPRRQKSVETESDLWLPMCKGVGEIKVTTQRYAVSFGGDENVLKVDGYCTTPSIQKNHSIMDFKWCISQYMNNLKLVVTQKWDSFVFTDMKDIPLTAWAIRVAFITALHRHISRIPMLTHCLWKKQQETVNKAPSRKNEFSHGEKGGVDSVLKIFCTLFIFFNLTTWINELKTNY